MDEVERAFMSVEAQPVDSAEHDDVAVVEQIQTELQHLEESYARLFHKVLRQAKREAYLAGLKGWWLGFGVGVVATSLLAYAFF